MLIKKRCRIDGEILYAIVIAPIDNNRLLGILCKDALDNNGVCPKGRKYSCEWGSFVELDDR